MLFVRRFPQKMIQLSYFTARHCGILVMEDLIQVSIKGVKEVDRWENILEQMVLGVLLIQN